VSYGRGYPAGNTYYNWPASLPVFGVKTTVLPVSVFDLPLANYNAYDKGRVPFVIDIMAFFRIGDSNVAAERVRSFDDLRSQLEAILQGASRTILATSEIEEILENRSIFGDKFTQEVEHQLTQWGVVPVKNIELMDIRDADGSKVIQNIMAKKKSLIESESRIQVAANLQKASVAEIDAQQMVAVRQQEAAEQVGMRTALKDQQIGIQTQKAQQAVKDEEKTTAEKTVAIQMVSTVGAANIDKEAKLVTADQQRQITVINADAEKQRTIINADAAKQRTLIEADAVKQQKITVADGTKQETIALAEGNLTNATLQAQGIQAQGLAKAEAEKALQLAPVTAQITLAKEIGENAPYQGYLVTIRQIEAGQAVGIEQAKALQHADIKIIANTGSPADGATKAMDLFGSIGGTRLGAFLEGLKNTDAGAEIIKAANGAAHM
jgi:flotillin